MGVYTSFHVVLGVYLTTAELLDGLPKEKALQSSCVHENARGGQYCSVCGRKVETYVREIPSDIENSLVDYLHTVAIPVKDDITGEYLGWLIGLSKHLDRDDGNTHGVLSRFDVAEALGKVLGILSDKRVLMDTSNIKADNIDFHYYMDQS